MASFPFRGSSVATNGSGNGNGTRDGFDRWSSSLPSPSRDKRGAVRRQHHHDDDHHHYRRHHRRRRSDRGYDRVVGQGGRPDDYLRGTNGSVGGGRPRSGYILLRGGGAVGGGGMWETKRRLGERSPSLSSSSLSSSSSSSSSFSPVRYSSSVVVAPVAGTRDPKKNFKVIIRVRPPLERELNGDKPYHNVLRLDPGNSGIAISENLRSRSVGSWVCLVAGRPS